MGRKIVLDYDKFKEFIESLEDQYKETYKGDWDWSRHTTFEVKEGHVLKKDRYYNNGTKPPDDSDEKILPFRFFNQQVRCQWYKFFDFPYPCNLCTNKKALKKAGVDGSQGVVDVEYRNTCLGKEITPDCEFYEPQK